MVSLALFIGSTLFVGLIACVMVGIMVTAIRHHRDTMARIIIVSAFCVACVGIVTFSIGFVIAGGIGTAIGMKLGS
jgi:hypothetical protein